MSEPTILPDPEKRASDTVEMFTAMAKEGGGPCDAQQIQYGTGEKGEPFVWFSMGLTKREQFAAMMLQSIIERDLPNPNKLETADEAISYADALLERLKK